MSKTIGMAIGSKKRLEATEIESLRQQLAELTMQCEKVVKWKHAMSYNDSYFGEPAGDLKRIVYEIERSMPIRGDK
jgi:hypothetical protein